MYHIPYDMLVLIASVFAMKIGLKVGGLNRELGDKLLQILLWLAEWGRESLSFKFRVILTYFCLRYSIKPWFSHTCCFGDKTNRFKRKEINFFQTTLLLLIFSFEFRESCHISFKILAYNQHIFTPYYAWSIELLYTWFSPWFEQENVVIFGSYVGKNVWCLSESLLDSYYIIYDRRIWEWPLGKTYAWSR